jgi:hypothetical protein
MLAFAGVKKKPPPCSQYMEQTIAAQLDYGLQWPDEKPAAGKR